VLRLTQIAIPTLVRVKDGALVRLGGDLTRADHGTAAALCSKELHSPLRDRVARGLKAPGIEAVAWLEVSDTDISSAARWFADLPARTRAVVGVGGGKALDVAKYVTFMGRLPYYAVPISLSDDVRFTPTIPAAPIASLSGPLPGAALPRWE
jgi:glycerol-1-phosphate dehydrogenase [NAD(P)+]